MDEPDRVLAGLYMAVPGRSGLPGIYSPGCFDERLGGSSGALGLFCRRGLVAVAGLGFHA
jgi:hypothetical protein